MGVVYKAKDPEIGRLVAIKTLRSVFLGDDAAGNEALKRFRQESRSAGRLRHPNIVTIFEAGRTENGSPYIVMEFIEGQSLEQMIALRAPIAPPEALHYLAQTASAIDYAHSQSVIHRDIKPSNVIVDGDSRPHLLDFGVAKLSDTSLTPAGTVVGTPSYMSPEQIRGETLDGATDLFALGVMAFELFTGHRPFPGKDFTTVVHNIIHNEPLTFEDVGIELPNELAQVLRKGLAKAKAERYSSALEFVDSMASVFGIVVDGAGIVGGFRADEDIDSGTENEVVQTMLRAPEAAGVSAERVASEPVSPPPPRSSGGAPGVADIKTSFGGAAPSEGYVNGSDRSVEPAMTPEAPGGAVGLGAPDPRQVAIQRRNSKPVSPKSLLAVLGVSSIVIALVLFSGLGDQRAEEDLAENEFVESSDFDRTLPGDTPENEEPIPSADVEPPATVLAERDRVVSKETAAITEPVAPPVDLAHLDERSLAQLSDAQLQYVLASSASLEDDLVRKAIGEAKGRGDRSFTLLLVSMLAGPNPLIKVDALKALSIPPHSEQLETRQALHAVLQDEDFLVRGFAAKVLGQIGDQESVAALSARRNVENNSTVLKILDNSIKTLQQQAQ